MVAQGWQFRRVPQSRQTTQDSAHGACSLLPPAVQNRCQIVKLKLDLELDDSHPNLVVGAIRPQNRCLL
jgi:hypothetical protein